MWFCSNNSPRSRTARSHQSARNKIRHISITLLLITNSARFIYIFITPETRYTPATSRSGRKTTPNSGFQWSAEISGFSWFTTGETRKDLTPHPDSRLKYYGKKQNSLQSGNTDLAQEIVPLGSCPTRTTFALQAPRPLCFPRNTRFWGILS